MTFRKGLVCVALAAALMGGAATLVMAQTAGYSVDKTSIGELLDNPKTKALFAKHFPEVIKDSRIDMARDMTLKQVEPMSEGAITDTKLAAMQADLNALGPTAAPAGLTEGAEPAPGRRAMMVPPPPLFVATPTASYGDWPTWGYDPQRTGWNRGETTLAKDNVGKLKVQWMAQLSTPTNKDVLSTVTAPVVIKGVQTPDGLHDMLFVLGSDDVLFALDANSGKPMWKHAFPNPIKPTKPADWLCPNTANDTPTIDRARGLIFFIASDGKLRGVSLADGSEKLKPVDFVAPFARAWSLNLVDNVIYSTSGRACGEVQNDTRSGMYAAAISGLRRRGEGPVLDASAIQGADVSDLNNPQVTRFYTSGARPAAPWGRGGAVAGPGGMILETSDGRRDPAAGDFSESVLKVSPLAARLMDSYTPTVWMDNLSHDLSGSASPVVFDFGGKTLVAVSQKESVLRLLDANNLGGEDHMTPLFASPHLGNDAKTGTDPSRGVWGGIATYETGGRRFLYLPLYGEPSRESPVFPVSNGPRPDGSIMAFEVVSQGGKFSAVPVWSSANMYMPDPPVVANGVVYALSTGGQPMQNFLKAGEPRMAHSVSNTMRSTPVDNLKLYAYDAVTGKQLFNSGKAIPDWVHFSEPVVALGKVFVVTHDARVFAFGVK